MNTNTSVPDCIDPWLDTLFDCRPLDGYHYAELHAGCVSILTHNPPPYGVVCSHRPLALPHSATTEANAQAGTETRIKTV